MRRASMLVAGILVLAPFTLAQSSAPESLKPQLPPGVLGGQLIAWSQLQKPRPVTEPAQPTAPSAQQPAQPATQEQPPAQSFAGTIVRMGSKYALRIAEGTSYLIDDVEKAQLFEGKQVKILGQLDASNNVLHVISLQTLS